MTGSPAKPARLAWRTRIILAITAIAGLIAFAWPVLVAPSSTLVTGQAPLVFGLVLPVVLAVILAELSSNSIDVKGLAMLGVLTAVGAALRPLSAGTAGLDLIFFLLILAGRVFGAGFGFALGALTLLTSALLTSGVGPWLPYQMIAAGFIGLFAGLLPRAKGTLELVLLCCYGIVSAFAFGWLMDFAFWPFGIGATTGLSFDPQASRIANLHTFVLYNIATSMGWNLGRALTNAVLLSLLGPHLLPIFRRVARRAVFLDAGNSGSTAASLFLPVSAPDSRGQLL